MTWRVVLRIGVVAAIFGVLWATLDAGEALRLLARADPRWLLGTAAALTVQTVLSALRWRLTAGRLGQKMGVRRAVSEYYLSQVVNQTLPGGMLGDAGRAMRARHQAGLIRSGQAVVFERVAGQAVMFGLMPVAVLSATVIPSGPTLPVWALWFAGLAPLAGLAVMGLVAAGAPLPGAAGRGARDTRQAFLASVLHPRALPWQVALSLGTAACNLVAFACAARATGTALSPLEVVVVVPLILTTMLIPVTISGWGLREGAAAVLFPTVGASGSAGVAASVAFGLVFLASVLPGVLQILADGSRRRRAGRRVDTTARPGLPHPTKP